MNVVVIVKDTHLGLMGQVLKGLRSHDFVYGTTLRELGLITGSVNTAGDMDALKTVPGVLTVEEERSTI